MLSGSLLPADAGSAPLLGAGPAAPTGRRLLSPAPRDAGSPGLKSFRVSPGVSSGPLGPRRSNWASPVTSSCSLIPRANGESGGDRAGPRPTGSLCLFRRTPTPPRLARAQPDAGSSGRGAVRGQAEGGSGPSSWPPKAGGLCVRLESCSLGSPGSVPAAEGQACQGLLRGKLLNLLGSSWLPAELSRKVSSSRSAEVPRERRERRVLGGL